MTWSDHLLAAALVIGLPIAGTITYRRLVHDLALGKPGARVREYWRTIALEWLLVAAVLLAWQGAGRPASALGIALPPGMRTGLGASITVLLLGVLLAQWIAIRRLDETGREGLRRQFGEAIGLIPVDEAEHRVFRLLAVTAGVCEEVLFRGFLIWYAGAAVGPWPAVLLTSAAFGLGHWYQGRAGMLKTAVAGLVAGGLYLATGSLLWPAILHSAIDLQGGAVGRMVRQPAGPAIDSPAA